MWLWWCECFEAGYDPASGTWTAYCITYMIFIAAELLARIARRRRR